MKADHFKYDSENKKSHVFQLRGWGYTLGLSVSRWTGFYGFAESPGVSFEIAFYRDFPKRAA